MRGHALSHHGRHGAGVGPREERVEQPRADAAALVAGVSGLGVIQLTDVVAEDGDRAGRERWLVVAEVIPVERFVEATGRADAGSALTELKLADVRVAVEREDRACAPSASMRRLTSSASPWCPMGTRPMSPATIGRHWMGPCSPLTGRP